MDRDYCLSRAEECELLANEAHDPKLARELRAMACDWRAAARAAANDNPTPGGWSAPADGVPADGHEQAPA